MVIAIEDIYRLHNTDNVVEHVVAYIRMTSEDIIFGNVSNIVENWLGIGLMGPTLGVQRIIIDAITAPLLGGTAVSEIMTTVEKTRCIQNIQAMAIDLYRVFRATDNALGAKYAALLFLRCSQVFGEWFHGVDGLNMMPLIDAATSAINEIAAISDYDLTVVVRNEPINILRHLPGRTHADLIGTWTLDVNRTEAVNEDSLFQVFGSGINHGYGLELSADGSFRWWIAIGRGGHGTHSVTDDTILAYGITFEQSIPFELEIDIFYDSEGSAYLVMNTWPDMFDYWIEYTLIWVRDYAADIQASPARAFERNFENAADSVILGVFDDEPGSVSIHGQYVFIDRRSVWPQENPDVGGDLLDILNQQVPGNLRSSDFAVAIFGNHIRDTSINRIQYLATILEDNSVTIKVQVSFSNSWFYNHDFQDVYAKFIYVNNWDGWSIHSGGEIDRPAWLGYP